LLVVIGIIALLIAILLPALSRAREQANRVKCMANHKQFATALIMYANEWKGYVPFMNSNSQETGGYWRGPGWLYWYDASLPGGGRNRQEHVERGSFWPYLRTHEVYHCPMDTSPYRFERAHNLSSYLMNQMMNCYGDNSIGRPFKLYKITAFKANSIVWWEVDDSSAVSDSDGDNWWLDGVNQPNQGLSMRHGGKGGKSAQGGIVSCIGGHAEWITKKEFEQEASGNRSRPTRIWTGPMEDR
jgi:hypothetical protein